MQFNTSKRCMLAYALAGAVLGIISVPFAAAVAPTATEENGEQAEQSTSYLRVAEDPGQSLALEIAERQFRPADGENGPRVGLVAVAHIADASFYDALQEALNVYDVVLYESVTPAGTSDVADDLNETHRVERTQAGLQFVASLLHVWHEEHRNYPTELEQLRAFAIERDARLRGVVHHAFVDGWGHALHYQTDGQRNGYELISYGADGEPDGRGFDADLRQDSDDPRGPSPFASEERNLQGELANALGLEFQLDAIDYDSANWRVADMSLGELQRELADRGVDFAPLEGALAGSSVPAKVAKFMLRMIPVLDSWTEGRVTDIFKIVLIEILGDESIMEQSLGQFGDAFTDVIINRRNQVALDQLRTMIAGDRSVESVAIFYGAGHMADLEQQLINEFNYTAAPDRTTWRSAISVNLAQSNLPAAQIEQMRRAMRRMLQQSMRQMEQMKDRGGQR